MWTHTLTFCSSVHSFNPYFYRLIPLSLGASFTRETSSQVADWVTSVQRHSPVLRIFLMTAATCPFSMELSNLTMRIKQEQRTSKDKASRIRPTAKSDRFTSTKRWWPTQTKVEHWNKKSALTHLYTMYYTVTQIDKWSSSTLNTGTKTSICISTVV